MEQRSQFTFYESFYHALSRIKKKTDRAAAYDAICAYALFGVLPDLETMSDSVAIAFELVKPNLDASRRKAMGGKKGRGAGERSGEDGAKMKERYGEDGAKMKERYGEDRANKGEIENKNEIEIESEIKTESENECYRDALTVSGENSVLNIPTLAQVEQFAAERNSTVSPAEFFQYYEQGGWCDSHGKTVHNWQQKFLAWEMRNGGRKIKNDPCAVQESESQQCVEDLRRMEEYLEQLRTENAQK